MKVLPKNEQIRKLLKHPVAKGFRAEGPADWPDDSFTARRIADGDVTVVEESKEEKPQERRTTSHKRQE